MIYALLDRKASHAQCVKTAQAILDSDHDEIELCVKNQIINHVMNADVGDKLHCIYCRDAVSVSQKNPPRGCHAKEPWHFMHAFVNDCIGVVRQPPTQYALGILNPERHGCYVRLGCESVPERDREQCQTIIDGATYCHLATTQNRPCVF
jgi:hypothetical protein